MQEVRTDFTKMVVATINEGRKGNNTFIIDNNKVNNEN